MRSFVRSLTRAAATLVLASASAVPVVAGVMHPSPGDPIRIDSGLVSGTLLKHGVRAYLGIPFAAAPVRGNRWRSPQPVKPWTGVYTADSYAPECMQPLRPSNVDHYFGSSAISENCLYLNVWAPPHSRAGARLPVVVWIYGGAWILGSASMPVYSGRELARKGVIYVAANYRLGVFGFLASPALTAESAHHASGDWGFLDQIVALKWVQRNIAAFGGNPANVTLIGQSAGSMAINDLQASPLARGLFERVVGMSGATVGPHARSMTVPLAQAEAEGVALQKAMGVKTLAGMRAVPADRVMAIARRAGVRTGPDIDGYFLPRSPRRIFEAGRQTDVPVLVGSTANDIGTDIPLLRARTVTQYRSLARAMFGKRAGNFLNAWPVTTDAQVVRQVREVARDSGFGLLAYGWAALQAATGRQPAFLYLFTRVQPFAPGVKFADLNPATAGAYHMSDVAYWLGTYNSYNLFRVTRVWTPLDRALSDEMENVIIAFARTGNPNTAHVRFRRFRPADPWRTVLGNRIHLQRLNVADVKFLLNNPVPCKTRRQLSVHRRAVCPRGP